jgi:hypothetical protein
VKFLSNIDSYQKIHVATVLPAADAIYRANGDLHKLTKDKPVLKLIARAIKENIRVLHALGHSGSIIHWVPVFFLIVAVKKLLKSKMAEIGVNGHAMAGRDEMDDLEREFLKLITRSHISTPSFKELALISEVNLFEELKC